MEAGLDGRRVGRERLEFGSPFFLSGKSMDVTEGVGDECGLVFEIDGSSSGEGWKFYFPEQGEIGFPELRLVVATGGDEGAVFREGEGDVSSFLDRDRLFLDLSLGRGDSITVTHPSKNRGICVFFKLFFFPFAAVAAAYANAWLNRSS